MRIVRVLQLGVVGAVVGAVAVASLSDSILRPLRSIGAKLLAVARTVESSAGVDLGSRSSLPVGADTVAHVLAWAVVGLVAAGLAQTAIRRINLFLILFGLSALLEVGQRHLSWSRSAELTDLAANGLGLAIGFGTALLIGSMLTAGTPRPRPRH